VLRRTVPFGGLVVKRWLACVLVVLGCSGPAKGTGGNGEPKQPVYPPVASPGLVNVEGGSPPFVRGIKLAEKQDHYSALIELYKVVQGETGDGSVHKTVAEYNIATILLQLGFYNASSAFYGNLADDAERIAPELMGRIATGIGAIFDRVEDTHLGGDRLVEFTGKLSSAATERADADVKAHLSYMRMRYKYRNRQYEEARNLARAVPATSRFGPSAARFVEAIRNQLRETPDGKIDLAAIYAAEGKWGPQLSNHRVLLQYERRLYDESNKAWQTTMIANAINDELTLAKDLADRECQQLAERHADWIKRRDAARRRADTKKQFDEVNRQPRKDDEVTKRPRTVDEEGEDDVDVEESSDEDRFPDFAEPVKCTPVEWTVPKPVTSAPTRMLTADQVLAEPEPVKPDCSKKTGTRPKGCPDEEEDEPTKPAVADRDKDGVPDANDTCPDASGSSSLKGCPDRDSDGIADREDRCPSIAGDAANKGCPPDRDGDGDGILDSKDECKTQPGPIALLGCPDADGDAIADRYDACPDQKGSIKTGARAGCNPVAVNPKCLPPPAPTKPPTGYQCGAGKAKPNVGCSCPSGRDMRDDEGIAICWVKPAGC
jgi:hypothetical protein